MELGIDFGTTFSSVCFSPAKKSLGCTEESDSIYIPTILGLRKDGTFCIGRAVTTESGLDVYRDIKRWVGCNYINEAEFRRKLKPEYSVVVDKFQVSIGPVSGNLTRIIPVVDLIYLYIKGLIQLTMSQTNLQVSSASCSVPADYNSFKRSFVFTACKALGIGVRAVINEPTAAGFCSLLEKSTGDTSYTLVYDFGGGTFDVSLLAVSRNVIVVVDSRGDNLLGGRDVDAALRAKCAELLGVPQNLLDTYSMEDVKIRLVDKPSVTTHTVLLKDGSMRSLSLTRADLELICFPYLERAANLVKDVITSNSVDEVDLVLIGGSSVLPGVRSSLLPIPQIRSIYFDKSIYRAAVAVGASLYTASFSGSTRYRLIDCVANSLSNDLKPFFAKLVLPKSHPIPTKVVQKFDMPTYNTAFVLHEGESPNALLNERCFSAPLNTSEFTSGVGDLEVIVGEDGRISASLRGRTLKNIVVVQDVLPSTKLLRFQDTVERLIKPEAEKYIAGWEAFSGESVTSMTPSDRMVCYKKYGVE
uniref:HSP70 n=1 Tax=Plum bark necrosis stem pitting-associated virus TaxID=675077 RepID=W8CQL6_9CLOS|nr:HSP70 [Plum bark necrosis stem pitting-associated virus]